MMKNSVLLMTAHCHQHLERPGNILGMANKALPKWIRFSADHRSRMEDYTALHNSEGNNDRWFLNRLRANLTIAAVSWWYVNAQGQDLQ